MQLFRFGLAALVLCLGPVALPASEGGFTATLSAEQQTAAGPAVPARASQLTKIDSSVKDRRRLEVHGSVSLMDGWGSGGRETQGSAFDLRFTDPAGRYSLELRYLRTDGTGFVDYAHWNELDWRSFR